MAKTEKRLVSFRTLKAMCGYTHNGYGKRTACMNYDNQELYCNAANCPIWRRAERKEGEE